MKHIQKKQVQFKTFQEPEKFKVAFNAGIPFFFEYARRHFLPPHYQNLLKEFNEIAPSVTGDDWVISKELINSIYIVAKQALKDHELAPARNLFYLLSLITPEQFDVWVGLGLTYQQLREDKTAIAAFEEAQKLQPQILLPYLCSAESYVQLQEWQKGYEICQQAASFTTPTEIRFATAIQEIQKQCAQKLQQGAR
jgi:tetratricopeptide (TPR) repeat protein